MKKATDGVVGAFHNHLVRSRRVETLASWFGQLAPNGSRILDVGCGDGSLCAILSSKRPDLKLVGIDVLPRKRSHIPVTLFDGSQIPFEQNSFDAVLLSDVLHHTDDPVVLLREAWRVTSQWVLLKDVSCKGFAAAQRLRFMDWVGNARFGVALPYNFWVEEEWREAWQRVGLQPEELVTRLGLYPRPADWIFGAQLHFVARLKKQLLDSHEEVDIAAATPLAPTG